LCYAVDDVIYVSQNKWVNCSCGLDWMLSGEEYIFQKPLHLLGHILIQEIALHWNPRKSQWWKDVLKKCVFKLDQKEAGVGRSSLDVWQTIPAQH